MIFLQIEPQFVNLKNGIISNTKNYIIEFWGNVLLVHGQVWGFLKSVRFMNLWIDGLAYAPK